MTYLDCVSTYGYSMEWRGHEGHATCSFSRSLVALRTTLGRVKTSLSASVSASLPELMWARGVTRLPYCDYPSAIGVVG